MPSVMDCPPYSPTHIEQGSALVPKSSWCTTAAGAWRVNVLHLADSTHVRRLSSPDCPCRSFMRIRPSCHQDTPEGALGVQSHVWPAVF